MSTRPSKLPLLSKERLEFAQLFEHLQDAKAGRPIRQYVEFKKKLKKEIDKNGYKVRDERFHRFVKSFPGHFTVIKDPAILTYLRFRPVISKYRDDWIRMMHSFSEAVREARADATSRRLMVFNDKDYLKIYQCFTHMQFMMTHRGEFDLYVYQRSADMDKLDDDLTFFAHVAKEFEELVGFGVSKIVVVYGNLHYKT